VGGGNDMNTETKVLSDLKVGQKGIVVKVASKGTIRRRIMEMGIITGTEILVKGFAPFGDPMELGIKGYCLSLRKSEASDIIVELV
jgi:Fe2+ transport system protein FeoA